MSRLDYTAQIEEAAGHNNLKIIKALVLVILDEFNRRRQFDADIAADLVRELNVLRTEHALADLTTADLTAQVPNQVTTQQVIDQVKAKLRA